MAVHLDDFQEMEFLNAARALAILFYTMHPGKSIMKFSSGEHGRGENGDHLGATIQALYADDILMLSSLAIQIKTENDSHEIVCSEGSAFSLICQRHNLILEKLLHSG